MIEEIKELARLWPEYFKKVTESKGERAYELIYSTLPTKLESWITGEKGLTVGSSGGTGNITAGPWFATFDTRVTSEPQKGYYLVFLFSVDMKRIVLELGFATKQFTEFYGENKATGQIMRDAAIKMQNATASIRTKFLDQEFISKLSLTESNLATTSKNKLQIGYEKASIYNLSYEIEQLDLETLRKDYFNFLKLYREIVDSPISPSIENLFEDSVELENTSAELIIPEVKLFQPRNRKSNNSHTSHSKSITKGKDNSESTSKKVGDLGEKIVLNYERDKLVRAGLAHLASKVVHEEAENNRPGWDISSFDEKGMPIQIEVKSSQYNSISRVNITANEWKAASQKKASYFIYLVTGVKLKKAKSIEIIQNPLKLFEKGEILLKVSAYDLKL